MLVFNGFLLRNFGFQLPLNVLQLQEVAKFVIEIFRLPLNFLRNVNVMLPHYLPFLVTAVRRSAFLFSKFHSAYDIF